MDINLKKFKRIGIMGGAFDPIHNQHLYIANLAKDRLNLDVVLFIPNGKMPHKDNNNVTDITHRFNMTNIAINDRDDFLISNIEMNCTDDCYTYKTLEIIKENSLENAKLFLIIGNDTLDTLHTWKNLEIVSSLATIVSAPRPNYYLQKEHTMQGLEKYNLDLIILEDVGVDISSTSIRNKLYNNDSVKYLVPDNVINYIKKNNLYSYKYSHTLLEDITKELKENLSEKRFKHTLGVLESAKHLASLYGVNEIDASISALLHDYSKEMKKDDVLKFINDNNIFIDDYFKDNLNLAHGLIGSIFAKNKFNISDENILNAIKYHTTARENMSLLEKVIYVSDCIEPNRNYESVNEIRQISEIDLDKAVIKCLEVKINFTKKGQKTLHPLSLVALNYYKEIIETY